MRQAKRDALMAAKPAAISETAERLLASYDRGSSVLLAGVKLIDEARKSGRDIAEPISLPL
jgi:hypothetical protein